MAKRPYIIAITGGPCSGKTTVQDALRQEFGTKLLLMPEVPTILLTNGYPRPGIDLPATDDWFFSFQKVVLPMQENMENQYIKMAEEKGVEAVIFDRGMLDGAAYMPESNQNFLKTFAIDPGEIFKRYDLIVHLQSVANCAPELYNDLVSSNEARYEDLEEAKVRDTRLQEAWQEHPNWHLIPGNEGIEKVVADALNLIRPHLSPQ